MTRQVMKGIGKSVKSGLKVSVSPGKEGHHKPGQGVAWCASLQTVIINTPNPQPLLISLGSPGDGIPESAAALFIFIGKELHVLLARLLGHSDLHHVGLEAAHHHLHILRACWSVCPFMAVGGDDIVCVLLWD